MTLNPEEVSAQFWCCLRWRLG